MIDETFMYHKIHGVRALIYCKNKLLILKRAELDKDNSGLWDLPGGAIENNEDIFTAVKREVLEETGMKSSAISIKDLCGLFLGKLKGKKLSILFFPCESKTQKVKLSTEHSEYLWINPNDMSKYKPGITIKAIRHILPHK